jgi:membrane protease subunit HflK
MADFPNLDDSRNQPPGSPMDAGSQALSEALRSSFSIVKVVMVLLLLLFLGSGIFKVETQERAIILRLGRPMGEGEKALLGPGLHFSLPYPIDEHRLISISSIQQVRSSVGWYATTPAQEAAGTEPPVGPNSPLNPAVEGYLLTADNNIIHARATLTYQISDPVKFVFGFVNASNTVQNALDNALLQMASQFNVDSILTRDVAAFNEAVLRRTREIVQNQDLGINLQQCTVQSIPPRQLKDTFANVLKSEVNRNKLLYDAHGSENQTLSKASADAKSRINLALSEKARLVNEVSSQAARFAELLPKYKANPDLFVQQRLTESAGRILPNIKDKFYVPEAADGNSKELRLLLNREPPKAKPEETK